ncbi:DUF58 domain-containing protein [Bacterioplanoides sp.]|uniref:DUF58 domain-containing protein n=1 Tax=Bacterioplanoides sp. TaxID=2066072 RepID=UPI003B59698F
MVRSSDLSQRLRPLMLWLETHVNPHRFLWLMSLLCFLIAWNRGIALLYGLVALMLALIIISWLGPWWNLRRLNPHRQQVGRASAGQTLTLRYRFANRKPAFFLSLLEQLPGDEQPQSHFISQLPPDGELEVNYDCPQRGVFQLAPCQLSSGWPFGFLQRRIRLANDPCKVEIYPRCFAVQKLDQPISDHPLPQDSASVLSRNAHSEFAGVRPYRQGDSLKHVHWAASARQQQLVMREFHSYQTPSWLMIIDGQRGSAAGDGADSSFEYALQIGASLLQYAQQQQLHFKLVITSKEPVVLDNTSGHSDLDDQLSALARVCDDGDLDYDVAVAQALQQYGQQQYQQYGLQHGGQPSLITVRTNRQALSLDHIAGHIDIVYNENSLDIPMARYPEGWSQPAANTRRLELHRLSNLAQVWNS